MQCKTQCHRATGNKGRAGACQKQDVYTHTHEHGMDQSECSGSFLFSHPKTETFSCTKYATTSISVRDRETERQRQRDRETERQRDRETERQREIESEKSEKSEKIQERTVPCSNRPTLLQRGGPAPHLHLQTEEEGMSVWEGGDSVGVE